MVIYGSSFISAVEKDTNVEFKKKKKEEDQCRNV